MPMNNTSDAKIGPPPANIIETEVKGDISLFDAERNEVVVLNATASDIWRLCDGEQSVDEIVSLIARAYDQPEEGIRDDVVSTISGLIESGFLPAP